MKDEGWLREKHIRVFSVGGDHRPDAQSSRQPHALKIRSNLKALSGSCPCVRVSGPLRRNRRSGFETNQSFARNILRTAFFAELPSPAKILSLPLAPRSGGRTKHSQQHT